MSSVYAPSESDWSERRPDRPLVVKCNYDGVGKRITFSSSRKCTYGLLKQRVEECFSLSATSYAITYTDDDGETTDITTEGDLTEAIRYFHAGTDDPPLSSAASILSGRSLGRGKITLRVKISVEYDGPSLSDTSSLASLEDRNASEFSLSLSSPRTGEVDDDSITVSSKDMGSRYEIIRGQGPKTVVSSDRSRNTLVKRSPQPSLSDWDQKTISSIPRSSNYSIINRRSPNPAQDNGSDRTSHLQDPSAVFERLKLQESLATQSSDTTLGSSPFGHERGAAWLRDQNARAVTSMLGGPPEPSESDQASVPDDSRSVMSGELELQKDDRGKFYYEYTHGSASSSGPAPSSYDSGYDDGSSINLDASSADLESSRDDNTSFGKPPTTGHAAPSSSRDSPPHASLSLAGPAHPHNNNHHQHRSHSEPILAQTDIPQELLPFITSHTLPPPNPTDCSSCGALLEALRYVCSICGEKESKTQATDIDIPGKGKGREASASPESPHNPFVYPPRPIAVAGSPSVSSWTLVGEENPFHDSYAVRHNNSTKSLPAVSSSPSNSASSSPVFGRHITSSGYELCAGCVEAVGVVHALECFAAPGSSPVSNDHIFQLRRTAPKNKGQLRHAFLEKQWGPRGWQDVEQDNIHSPRCSVCDAMIVSKRYKCFSCGDFSLCRACYNQVHEIHPSHAFLVVPEKPARMRSEPAREFPTIVTDTTGEPSMTHVGVKCTHCLLEIVGARFHCAICPAVDICSNCDSAGLPGNLDSVDGGHNSSHIMIKIPFPLPSNELQVASRHAIERWNKDGPMMQGSRSRRDSLLSSYARTVTGHSATTLHAPIAPEEADNHKIRCSNCTQNIIGTRYQCASCPSKPDGYNLCSHCEALSYVLHDPMHIFFKIPRPVDTPVECDFAMLPILYSTPAGPGGAVYNTQNPKEYLQHLTHRLAVCDRCMQRITGEWFRCVYCPKDLCEHCESVDTHDNDHFFMVLKSQVDWDMFRAFAQIGITDRSPPVVSYPVYHS